MAQGERTTFAHVDKPDAANLCMSLSPQCATDKNQTYSKAIVKSPGNERNNTSPSKLRRSTLPVHYRFFLETHTTLPSTPRPSIRPSLRTPLASNMRHTPSHPHACKKHCCGFRLPRHPILLRTLTQPQLCLASPFLCTHSAPERTSCTTTDPKQAHHTVALISVACV